MARITFQFLYWFESKYAKRLTKEDRQTIINCLDVLRRFIN